MLFDLDGTLADTAADLTAALNRVLDELSEPYVANAQARPHVSRGALALLRLGLRARQDDPRPAALLPRFLEFYAAALCEETRLFPGIEECLDRLDGGHIPFGVVTNKPREYTLPILERLDVARRLSAVVCGDDLAVKKPHPAPLRRASEEFEIAAHDIVYVGDDRRDVTAGFRAGMPTIIAAWGYLGPGETPETWGANAIAATPLDLLEWIP